MENVLNEIAESEHSSHSGVELGDQEVDWEELTDISQGHVEAVWVDADSPEHCWSLCNHCGHHITGASCKFKWKLFNPKCVKGVVYPVHSCCLGAWAVSNMIADEVMTSLSDYQLVAPERSQHLIELVLKEMLLMTKREE